MKAECKKEKDTWQKIDWILNPLNLTYISGMPQKSLSCSEEFRELMDLPTSGARNLKHHLAKAKSSGRVSLHLL